MKYFIINTTIRDGEFEYLSQSPIKAKNEQEALDIAEQDAKEWTQGDYREYEIRGSIHNPIPKKDFDIVKKYIY